MNWFGDAWTMFRTVSYDNPVFGSEDSDTPFLLRMAWVEESSGACAGKSVMASPFYGDPVRSLGADQDCGCCWIKKEGSYPNGTETPVYMDCSTGKIYTDPEGIPPGHGVCVINIVGEHDYVFGFSGGGANDPCPRGSDYFCIIPCACEAPCGVPSADCQFPNFWYAEVGAECDCPTLGNEKARNLNSSHGKIKYKCLLCACLQG
jgi:hypothetical protein